MKIWLVKARDLKHELWFFDCYRGFIIRAESEKEAREIADEDAAGENVCLDDVKPWLDSKYSSCEEIKIEGEKGIVLSDYHAG